MPHRLLTAGLAVLAALSLAAPVPAQDISFEKYSLDNGLDVILHEDHSLPVASINLWYFVGAKDEIPGRSGFAHLFEHLMFMGTERVPDNQFDVLMEGDGGWNNASTSWDRTNYFSFGPSNLLPTLLWLDADRLEDLGRTMTEEKLNTQREVVRNERRQTSEMRPYGRADLEVSEIMYPAGHPYHIEVIGTHEDLQAATLQDVKDFFARHYIPNNASLVVAGDFDPEKIKPLVARLFGTIPGGEEPEHAMADPVLLDGVKRVTRTDAVQFPRLSLVYHSPALYDPGDAEMQLAAAVLGSGKSSRLYKRLVYEDKLAGDVRVSQSSAMLGSLFRVDITAREGVTLERIESAADEVLAEFVANGPTEEELVRHRASLERRMLTMLQSVLARADRLNRYNFHFGDPNGFERDLDRYRRATVEDVKQWAGQVLTADARLVMKVVPEPDDETANPRDEQPEIGSPGTFAMTPPDTFILTSGSRVHHWQRSELPLVELTLLLHGGSVHLDGTLPGRASLAAGMLGEGAGSLDALEFSDAMELLGAQFYSYATREATWITLSVTRQNFPRALRHYADAVLQPRFDEEEWNRVKSLRIEALKRAEDRPATVAERVGLREFFGPAHPFAYPASGTVSGVEPLTLDSVKAASAQIRNPENATFFIAGDLSADEARRALEEVFSEWKGGATKEALTGASIEAPVQRSLRLVLVDKPGAVQTVIRFFMPGPVYAHPDRVAYESLNTILGGSFTSRLNQNLRETHGFTYGARSRFEMYPSAGYFTAASTVQAEVTGRALEEFLTEFRGIRSGSITAEEAQKARSTNRMSMIESFQGLDGLIDAAAERELNGLAFASLAEDLTSIATIDNGTLNDVSEQAVALDHALVVLVGDRTVIRDQLEGSGLPEPVELTVSGEPVKRGP